MTSTNEDVRLIFEKALREAYNSGWAQGEREHISKRGGIPWDDSDLQRNGPDRLLAALLALERERTAGLVEALRAILESDEGDYHVFSEAREALAAYDALKGEG